MPVPKAFAKNLRNKNNLAIITLNVGDGDAIIIKFPHIDGKKACAVVDCYNADKTIAALEALAPDSIPFICATHPHYDHTSGMSKLIKWTIDKKKKDEQFKVGQFWDSGFRHVSATHYNLIKQLRKSDIDIVYPTSGYECSINRVAVNVLSPSIRLKNRYDTFGTNINNASIVLKLEYPPKDIAGYFQTEEKKSDKELAEEERLKQNTVILAGDAQFDAWAIMTDEFPTLRKTENRGQLIDAKVKKHKPLKCQVLKAPHHMSKHGISLEVLETLLPEYTIASCANKSKHDFPHELTVLAAKDIYRKVKTDRIFFTGHPKAKQRSGTVVSILRGGRHNPLVYALGEKVSDNAPL